MFKGLFFIIFIINIRTSSCAIEALYEAGRQVWKLYMIIDNKQLNISYDADATEQFSDDPIIQELKEQMDEIHESLNELEIFIDSKGIRKIIKIWVLDAPIIRGIETIEIFIQWIDEYYAKFHSYRNESFTSRSSYGILMKDIFLSLEGNIQIIRKYVINEDKSILDEEDIVSAIVGYAKALTTEICGTSQVISEILIHLFRMIIIAELKATTMLAYENIYAYVKNKDKQVWQRINSLAREKLEKQFAIYMNIFQLNMAVIDRVYNRACDPPGGNWTRGESFYELEKTFQEIIFHYDRYSCESKNCISILSQEPGQCEPLFYRPLGMKSPGDTVSDCVYLSNITACVLKQNNGTYKFQYVNSAELGLLGRNHSCPQDNGEIIESTLTPLFSYAACTCNFRSSRNKISLLMIESDVKSNKVIIGLRFVLKNGILWIQPKEGTLNRNGHINNHPLTWIPIPENLNSSLTEPINEKNRIFFLDDVTLPTSKALTGIKFYISTREDVSGFAIQIFGTFFNYKTGKLFLDGDRVSWRELDEKSGKSLSFNPISSVFTKMSHTVTPSDTKYISLNQSSLEEDFGQSTLPLFDAVPITFDVPSPLGGVGIFHKGVVGYAGFISLRVYGINYKEYFDDFEVFHIINDRVSFNSSFQ